MLRHGRFLVAVLRLCPQRGHKASPSATLPLLPARVAWPCATFSHWPNAMGQRVASLRWHCPPRGWVSMVHVPPLRWHRPSRAAHEVAV